MLGSGLSALDVGSDNYGEVSTDPLGPALLSDPHTVDDGSSTVSPQVTDPP